MVGPRTAVWLACLGLACRSEPVAPAQQPVPAPVIATPAPPSPAPPTAADPLADTLQAMVALFVAIDGHDAALEQDPDDRRALDARREAVAAVDRLRVIAGEQARRQPGFLPPDAPTFARILADLAQQSGGRLQPLIDAELGLFVIHNVAGSQPHVDRVTSWPGGEHPYAARLDEKAILKRLVRAPRWPARAVASLDDDGCTRERDAVALAGRTAFAAWGVVLGIDAETVPDRFRLDAWPRLRARFPDIDEDLDAAEYEQLRRAGLVISHSAYVDGVRLDFGNIAGRWVLLAVDILDDECG